MAILWRKQAGATCYEVRTAGQSRRLYTNGVFHSQYNPRQAVTGNVWDLLFLPAMFYPPGTLRRILVLGVGGGAVIQMLRRFVAPEMIVGVDLSAVHLQVARRFFGVRGPDVALHHADACVWLEAYAGPPFDMIVDDLFGERDGEPVRAVTADRQWAQAILGHLAPAGLVVTNFAGRDELNASAYRSVPRIRQGFASAFSLVSPQNENVVAAFLRQPASAAVLKKHLKTFPELDADRRACRLRYRMRRL